MTTVLIGLNVGNPLAILLVLFVPGYVLTAALFPASYDPAKLEIDWIERIALSFGLSIAIVPLLGLLLTFTPFGIRFTPIVATIAIFTTIARLTASGGYAAYWRSMRLHPNRRLSVTVDFAGRVWKMYMAIDKG